jgi:hypothetical protein
MYAFAGVVFLGAAVTELVVAVSQLVKEKIDKAKKKALAKSNAMIKDAIAYQETHGHAHDAASFREAKTGLWEKMHGAKHHAWKHGGIAVKLLAIGAQLFAVWSFGSGLLLAFEDDLSFTQCLYCCVITSLSVGYGDFYPVTQYGRLSFAFYIPVSVCVVIGTIPQLIQIMTDVGSIQVIKYESMSSIMEMDQDSDGHISETEYVLFSLIARQEVDEEMVDVLRAQFKAMDADQGGTLTVADFPKSVCVRRTVTITNGEMNGVELKVVSTKEADHAYEKVGEKFVPCSYDSNAPKAYAHKKEDSSSAMKANPMVAMAGVGLFKPGRESEAPASPVVAERKVADTSAVTDARQKGVESGGNGIGVMAAGSAGSAGSSTGWASGATGGEQGVDLNSISADDIAAMAGTESKFFV